MFFSFAESFSPAASFARRAATASGAICVFFASSCAVHAYSESQALASAASGRSGLEYLSDASFLRGRLGLAETRQKGT
jgi:hypothetical protein